MPSHDTIDDVTVDYLSICVRERRKDGSKFFNHEKRYMLEGERIQEMKIISAKEFVEYVRSSDSALKPLEKIRQKFIVDT